VLVARGEGVEVVETVNGDSILWSVITDSSCITGDLALSNVVGSLGTKKEAIATEDSIGGEGGTLEDVESAAGVNTRLLVDGVKESGL